MENRKPLSHITVGLILAGLLIVVSSIVSIMSGGNTNPGGGWMSYIIIIGGLAFFVNRHGNANENRLQFGELFSYGFKSTTMMTLVFVIFVVILSFASPELKEKAIEEARANMEKNSQFSETEIETGLTIVKKYFWVLAVGGTVLSFAIIGAIGSLIGAAITKKNPKTPFEEQPMQ